MTDATDIAALSPPEATVLETVGDLMKFWGFSRHTGRIWGLLYLREEPLNSTQLQHLLEMSAGLVSMSLKELQHWDVVDKVEVAGDRKDYYTASVDVWHMVSRVLREREYQLLRQSERALDDALGELECAHDDPELSAARVAYMKPRVARLGALIRSATMILDALLKRAEADLGDLRDSMENLPG